MLDRESKTDLGSVRIKDEVISSIAYFAAKQVPGVVDTNWFFWDYLIHLIFKKWPSKGVKVEIRSGDIKILVYVVLEYGVDIASVANAIQENVKASIEKMTGIGSIDVDVNVQKILPAKKVG